MDKKKEELLKNVCLAVDKKFGKGSVMYLGDTDIPQIPRVPSGCIAIDTVTGGGYPQGRIVEIFGGESSGKTTSCYHSIAEYQRKFPDQFCALIDSEFCFDAPFAATCGVKVDELMVAQPENGNEGFAILQMLIESGAVLVVVDSVAAMVPREEAESEEYTNKMGLQARMMSQALRKMTSIVGKYKSTVIFTNQTREKIGVLYGDPTTTSGGNSLKFYASIRLKFSKAGNIEVGPEGNKEKVSIKTRVECVKNKTAPPFKKAEFIITFGKGIDNEAGLFEAILESGLIEKKGGGYMYIDGVKVAQGIPKLKEYFEANPIEYEKLKKKMEAMPKTTPKPETKVSDEPDAETMSDEEIVEKVVEEAGEIGAK